MNRTILFGCVMLLSVGFSHSSELLIPKNSGPDYQSFQQIPLERKLQRLLNCERGVYKLPLDASYIRGTLIPEIEAARAILAPNYPETNGVFGTEKETLLSTWIQNYPSEYDAFIVYYETQIRSYH